MQRGGVARAAAGTVAQSAAPSTAEAAAGKLLDRVRAATGRIEALADASDRAHQAQVREALTRTELTLALNEALLGRAEAQARLRDQAFGAYSAARLGQGRLRRRNRLSRLVDRALGRLMSPGQALVIARSGLWRGSGRRLFDLRHMAAYARRGANPGVEAPTLFDQAWYLTTYPDVAQANRAPLVHYLLAGADDGRAPHPLFDVDYYRRGNAQELAGCGLSPLEHYLRRGAALGRPPHPLFDIVHYVSQQPRLGPGEDPLSHYLREGWTQGLSPHPLFDAAWYRRQAPRTAQGAPPLLHYVQEGWRRGLSPHPLFDPQWYLEQYPDVAAAGAEPLAHFLTQGAEDGRSPSPWFDLPHYVAARGEALGPANPLVDYLQGGAWAVVEARPGFPTAAYLAASPELVREGLTPLEHWARRHAR